MVRLHVLRSIPRRWNSTTHKAVLWVDSRMVWACETNESLLMALITVAIGQFAFNKSKGKPVASEIILFAGSRQIDVLSIDDGPSIEVEKLTKLLVAAELPKQGKKGGDK